PPVTPSLLVLLLRRPPRPTLFPYTTLFRSLCPGLADALAGHVIPQNARFELEVVQPMLHDVADGDDAAQAASIHDDEMAEPLAGHSRHQRAYVVVHIARSCTPHDARQRNRTD